MTRTLIIAITDNENIDAKKLPIPGVYLGITRPLTDEDVSLPDAKFVGEIVAPIVEMILDRVRKPHG